MMLDWLWQEYPWVTHNDIILHNTDEPLELLVHPYGDIGYRTLAGNVDVLKTVDARIFDGHGGRWREIVRLHPQTIIERRWGRQVWFYVREV